MQSSKDSVWYRIISYPLMSKTIVLVVLLFLLWILKPFFNLIMMTLFLTILMGQIALVVRKYLRIPVQLTILSIYAGFFVLTSWAIAHYWHKLVGQLGKSLASWVGFYSTNPHDPIKIFHNVGFISAHSQYQLLQFVQRFHINDQLASLPKLMALHVGDVTKFGFDLILAIVLSFVITMELPQLQRFNQNFYHSKLPRFFKLLFTLLHQFIQAFMVSIDVQLSIAFINMLITTSGLIWLGFPNIVVLAIMVWVFSLIPVLGAFLSFIPLALIGFATGGIYDVVVVSILLIVVHILEAYVINPKLTANRTKLPVAYTLIALIVGDLYLGVWGLLLAVPILIFSLDFLGVVPLPQDNHVDDEFIELDSTKYWIRDLFKKIHNIFK